MNDQYANGTTPPPDDADLEDEEGGEGEPVDPEDQAMYDRVMTAAMAQLFGDDGSHAAIVEKLKGEAENIIQGIAHTAAMMIMSIAGNAEQQGVQISAEILVSAGTEVVAELVEIAEAANLVQPEQSEQVFSEACLNAVKIYGEMMEDEGKITSEVQAESKAMMQAEMAAEGEAKLPKTGLVGTAMKGGK